MLQLGDTVEATGLGADGGDWGLEHHAISTGWGIQNEARLTWKEAARKALGRARRLNIV